MDENEEYTWTNYEHTPRRPFCDDMACECHESKKNLENLGEWFDEGLIGEVDGDLIYRGRAI